MKTFATLITCLFLAAPAAAVANDTSASSDVPGPVVVADSDHASTATEPTLLSNPTLLASTAYRGFLAFQGRSVLIKLYTNEAGSKVNVWPSYYRRAARCNKQASGELFTGPMSNKAWLTVDSKGRFSGKGHSTVYTDSPVTMHFKWTAKGRFTSPTTTSGTIRITGRAANNGKTYIRCKAMNVKWETKKTLPADDPRA